MAISNKKRGRVEDEVRRPKKKIRKFKKQKEYHSSSEDDEPELDRSTAPVVRPPKTTPKNDRDLKPLIPALKKENARTAKGSTSVQTLEVKSNEEEAEVQDEDDESDQSEDDDELTTLETNTALNMNPGLDSEDDSVQDLDELEDDEPELLDDDEIEDENDDGEEEEDSDGPGNDSMSDASTTNTTTKKKRNDPTAFATSISKILTTKLTTSKRSDPILSRSKTANEANKAIVDGKLDVKARAAIRAERKSLLEKGRVRDVLGLETPGIDTGAIMEEEKRLKKTAQRGVVKLFNAVRAAQVKAEEAERQAKEQGVVGMHKREEKVNEMSKEGFLELLSRGGKTAAMEA